MKYLSAFIITLLVDFAWAKYITAVADEKKYEAGFYSALIYILSGTVVLWTVEEPKVLIFGALGALVGTLLSVKDKGSSREK